MNFVPIDRVLLEVSPGEARAVAYSGDEPWEIATERPFAGPAAGDIYRVRAGGLAQGGGRFFDMGGGISGVARRPRGELHRSGRPSGDGRRRYRCRYRVAPRCSGRDGLDL